MNSSLNLICFFPFLYLFSFYFDIWDAFVHWEQCAAQTDQWQIRLSTCRKVTQMTPSKLANASDLDHRVGDGDPCLSAFVAIRSKYAR
jgi:hypothetical protein